MDSRIIEKIRKLLALAGNNPSETDLDHAPLCDGHGEPTRGLKRGG